MRWGDIQLKTSAERQTKTRTGAEPKDIRVVKQKMFSVPDSDRDPVQAYHLYASKRPEQMKSDDSPFYLAANYTRVANSSKPSFKAAPMGFNKLNSLMKTMAEKAGLNAKNLTNHSARKRMIQKLNDHEVPPTHIMQISRHKNVQSLNDYSSLSEKQQRDISNIMSAIALQLQDRWPFKKPRKSVCRQETSNRLSKHYLFSKEPTYKEEHLTFR